MIRVSVYAISKPSILWISRLSPDTIGGDGYNPDIEDNIMRIFSKAKMKSLSWTSVIPAFTLILSIVTFVSALLVFYSTQFTEIHHFLVSDADALFIPSLYGDLTQGGNLSGWRMPPGTYFFPDIALYFIVASITRDMFTAVSVSGLVQFLIFIAGLLYLAKHVMPEMNACLRFSTILLGTSLFLFTTAGIYGGDIAFTTVHHFGVMVSIPWVLAFVMGYLNDTKPNYRALILLLIISLLMGFSDSFYFVQFVAPLLASLFLLVLVRRVPLRKALVLVDVIGVGSMFGKLAYNFSTRAYPSLSIYLGRVTMGETVSTLWNVLLHFISQYTYHALGLSIFIALCVVIVLREIGVLLKKVKIHSHEVNLVLFALYFIVSLVGTLVAIIVSGMYVQSDAVKRYFIPYLLMSAWIGFPFVLRFPKTVVSQHRATALCFALLLTMAFFVRRIHPQQAVENFTDQYYPEFYACLDEQTEALGLQYGIAGYWQARPISALSKNNLTVVQVVYNFNVFHWMNNIEWYDIEPQFVVVHYDPRYGAWAQLEENDVLSRFGEPDTTFMCEDSKVLVYNGEDSTLKSLFSDFNTSIHSE